MLMNQIDCHHFIALSLTLSVAGGHKVSAKQLKAVFSHAFQMITMEFYEVLKQFKLKS